MTFCSFSGTVNREPWTVYFSIGTPTMLPHSVQLPS